MRRRVQALDPATYVAHRLHGPDNAWVEKNCYVDIWIEVLHAQGLDPMAVLPFTLANDFEGDQWTFFKPPHGELRALYGIDVHELNVWRPLLEHAEHHVGEGKLVITEADAFYLPDTAGTDYRAQHTKTTIVIQDVDADARRLGYFHNAGYHELSGADFASLMRLDAPPDPTFMPLFAELARLDRVKRLPPAALVAASLALLRGHLAARPRDNPVTRFRERFAGDLDGLRAEGLAHYHAYAFATIRQCGAGFELASRYLAWLGEHGEAGLEPAVADFERISATSKAMILKAARAVNGKRAVDFGEMMTAMEASWASGLGLLVARYGG